jgi:universal stress protein F
MQRTIIVPVDLSQEDAGAKALAKAKQIDSEAKLILLYVAPPIPTYVAMQIPADIVKSQAEEAQKRLSALAERMGVTSNADLMVRSGHPGREIIGCAEEADAELIVIASHDPGWGDLLLGSVAAFVVRHAHCSVLVVRDQTGEGTAR